MELLDTARELGSQLQLDDSYIDYNIAKQNYELDKELQEQVEKFNLTKVEINYEISKQNPDQKKLEELNQKLNNLYNELMKNENMKTYNETKSKLNDLLGKIMIILNGSAEGEDPFSINVDKMCSGSCSSCQGCN